MVRLKSWNGFPLLCPLEEVCITSTRLRDSGGDPVIPEIRASPGTRDPFPNQPTAVHPQGYKLSRVSSDTKQSHEDQTSSFPNASHSQLNPRPLCPGRSQCSQEIPSHRASVSHPTPGTSCPSSLRKTLGLINRVGPY